MIGLVQKVLVDLVREAGGEPALQAMFDRAGVLRDWYFRIDTPYPDEEFLRLFEACGEVLELSRDELMEAYADAFSRDTLARFPAFFRMARDSREFLRRQPTIHNTFATGLVDPEERRRVRDKFSVEDRPDGSIVTTYRSKNGLHAFYVALARRVVEHYGDEASFDVTAAGPNTWRIHVRWSRLGGERA